MTVITTAQHQSHIPHLRFSGFFGDWEEKKLEEIKTSINSGVSVNSIDEQIQNEGDFGILKTSSVLGGKFFPKENKKILESEPQRATLKPQKNNILVSRMNTPELVGHSGYIEKDFEDLFIPDRLWSLKINDTNNAKLISMIISSPKFMSQISNIATGTSNSMKNISQPNFLNLPLSLPSLPEQTKIADFLTVVDEKIQSLSQMRDAWSDYKTGLMQQIFSQQIRFPGFTEEWEEKELGALLTQKSKRNKNLEVELVLSVSNKKGFVTQEEQFDGHQVASNNLENYKIVEQGDFAYNPSRINVGSIARLTEYKEGIVSPMYTIFSLNKSLNPIIFENLLKTHRLKHMIKIACSGSVRDTLNFDDMCNFVVKLPSLPEQEKIANLLSSIDDKITELESQIQTAKQWKKGLLQGLFI